jgi:hypothetical protein
MEAVDREVVRADVEVGAVVLEPFYEGLIKVKRTLTCGLFKSRWLGHGDHRSVDVPLLRIGLYHNVAVKEVPVEGAEAAEAAVDGMVPLAEPGNTWY